MPEMDGYETMRTIRKISRFRSIPIIALTAKAMKGDRQKCLEAGASDYVTKPVELEQLFSALRVWIARCDDLAAHAAAEADARVSGVRSGDPIDVLLPAPAGPVSAAALRTDQPEVVEDDRNAIQAGDAVLLIIEDDPTFARILVDMAHERSLKALVALRGNTAISLAREFRPGAITLDVNLPDMAGWTILDRLKHHPETRHIPVHIISGDDDRRRGLALGAMTYLEKTITKDELEEAFGIIQDSAQRRTRTLLIASPAISEVEVMRAAVSGEDLDIFEAGTGTEALKAAMNQYFDGISVGTDLGDMSAADFIDELQRNVTPWTPPVVVYGPDGLAENEAARMRQLSNASVVRFASSLARVLDETVLLLHRAEADLSEAQQQILGDLRETNLALAGRKVLVVDDDVRNIFALTSVLEDNRISVLHAENGRAGIELLATEPNIDAVLMDIMMPEMDGFETMRAIRNIPRFRALPIIALTAKAMKGDREKCLEAGATDYVAKPVDLDQLFAVLRVSILRQDGADQAASGNG